MQHRNDENICKQPALMSRNGNEDNVVEDVGKQELLGIRQNVKKCEATDMEGPHQDTGQHRRGRAEEPKAQKDQEYGI